MIIEICATTLNSVINAQDAGADRIELCQEYLIGGITPSQTFTLDSIENSRIPINILIRPRGGDFNFTDEEFDTMIESIYNFKNYNVNGFVVGFLNDKNKLDSNRLAQFRDITKGYELIFHRAFDYLDNQDESLELLIENRFDRILCSGSTIDSEQGLKKLIYLKNIARNKISIMPGGGVNLINFNLFKISSFNEIHLSAIDKNISLDSNYDIIKQIVEMSK
ncbi:copper homeostasis protein CutC [Flavobacteriaceae bacterium]|jgi:copper homeostasis protein|nr:copper homeostasis protein CutC [Flavobacteriaceae bacterium]MDA9041527.1 copper homeostasis protein CutC [Flavobacteriaceae bacterium]MDA9276477.1 copper homeostasis protein CutC [Flavobacteriaceae bacterium]MDC0923479.1 copper homeostasis protein CutC [Flavobacteriaceae bacterium]MDC6462134.1 copper homeostasis protein CutC [Flavobacteriaceae bacterium]|tara:strand:- start:232 stop:897 length:666 start_codon:yes stop_codon:yes gene_type:complete